MVHTPAPFSLVVLLAAYCLTACVGGKGTSAAVVKPPVATPNTVTVTVDSGPAAAPMQVNHAYVTVKVCVPGSKTQCANIDHVQLDTGSWGLRLVGSVLASQKLALAAETDASGRTVEECATFTSGSQTWGPVVQADVYLAGEIAIKLPIQIMDDTNAGAAPPSNCGGGVPTNLANFVASFGANGLLGVGVLAQDCGSACVSGAAPAPQPGYFGCGAGTPCVPVGVPLNEQVTNPVAFFATDNNGVIVTMPKLVNANGDSMVQGTLTFGIDTQTDNALPASGLTVLGVNAAGDFNVAYNGAMGLPGRIDSGAGTYFFDAPSLTNQGCIGQWAGYYCPVPAPLIVSAVISGVGANNGNSTINFAVDNPNNGFVTTASAFIGLATGASSVRFDFGMPFFYGRSVYIGINQRTSGTYTGPYNAF